MYCNVMYVSALCLFKLKVCHWKNAHIFRQVLLSEATPNISRPEKKKRDALGAPFRLGRTGECRAGKGPAGLALLQRRIGAEISAG